MRIENQRSFREEERIRERGIRCLCEGSLPVFPEPEEEYKYRQRRIIEHYERTGLNCVQSFIDNISFPNSLEELLDFSGRLSLVDNILDSSENEWTVPKWAKANDIVFFMHTKTARSTITRLRTELTSRPEAYSPEDYRSMMETINHGLATHAKYGGKIFAIGRVCGGTEYVDDDDDTPNICHWSSRHYAAIDHIAPLATPIDISEFNSYITVSRCGAITPVWGDEFDRLKKAIGQKNKMPWFLKEPLSKPVPLRKINESNWIAVANDYRRSFILENQFRSFYVDYLLRSIGDRKTFFQECRCTKPGINPSFIDNVFLYSGKYLAVEVKLSVHAEPNIHAQLSKYCYNTAIHLNKDGRVITSAEMHPGKVLAIDTEMLYMYDAPTDTLNPIFQLDDLCSLNDLPKLKTAISAALE